MQFSVKNTLGTIVIKGQTYTNGAWVDLVPFWAFGSFEATENDVDGTNAGRATNGYMYRDKIAEKQKINFVSVPLLHTDAVVIKNLVRPSTFEVRTDYFTGTNKTLTMYSNNRVMTHIRNYDDGTMLVKIAFPMVEV